MSSILSDDIESFEAASFRTTRPPYVLTSTSSSDPPLFRTSCRHVVVGEPWTNATGVLFAAENFAELAVGDLSQEDVEFEQIAADTEHIRSADFLARTLDAISRPTERENTPIGFDPDDYPLF